ncbi:Shikimate dehydrogenase [Brevundimonas diminuta]|uniref:shikimate dehydrogenase family protein n=1 Tax=Brevundimonas diminuta TaxID=293 RepID=UPI000207F2F2|nr:shikimate dehydrogenase [Brevundimonas diminuta]EGF96036.1 shikimate 5-dehydrogenase [Brevundimonas diminuta ATCC 11568]OWR22793.1 shikimate dehydrogenase [Brevundimonas diminuta]WQE45098.1 shikimate dehydrogenase [Brevundimonas diminuta]SPU45170.1 Shikimate dehydrogenase [Brevundimonas diminuta]SUW17625.1 Shikimate dehydrogenase [Brevundimonas diminuta]
MSGTPVGRITGAALLGGIVGNPVSHSLSPVIHNAWLETGGVDGAYVAFAPKDAAGFEALVAAGRAGLIAGVNVTAPFKEQAFALADEAAAAAQMTGSANILVFEDGRVRADSADGAGVLYALAEQAPKLKLDGASVVMLGAGGAARAGAGALIEAGAALSILNRTRERAEALAADLGPAVSVAPDAGVLEGADLVINALSVAPDISLAALKPSAVVMDMTYKPVVTPLLAAARARGLTTVDGLAMLIGQAAPSFEAIFRRPPPTLDLRAILLNHLGETA